MIQEYSLMIIYTAWLLLQAKNNYLNIASRDKVLLHAQGGPLKYNTNSVHMCDQHFSKTTLNEFLLSDEKHPLS